MASEQKVKKGTALSRATAGDTVEACLVQWSEAARAFGDVERDRDARAVELIAKRGEKHAALARNELGGERLELYREPVHLKLLGVKQRRLCGGSRRSGSGSDEARTGSEEVGHRNLLSAGPRRATLTERGRPKRPLKGCRAAFALPVPAPAVPAGTKRAFPLARRVL